MQIIGKTTKIDFMGRRRLAIGLSIVLVIVSIVALATRGLQFGIDFTGGVLIEVLSGRCRLARRAQSTGGHRI